MAVRENGYRKSYRQPSAPFSVPGDEKLTNHGASFKGRTEVVLLKAARGIMQIFEEREQGEGSFGKFLWNLFEV